MDGKNVSTGTGSESYPAYRWYVLIVLCVLTVALADTMISPAPLMGVISKSLNLELGATTACLMASYQIALALFCIAGGFICGRYGLVWTFIGGSILFTTPTRVQVAFMAGSMATGFALEKVFF